MESLLTQVTVETCASMRAACIILFTRACPAAPSPSSHTKPLLSFIPGVTGFPATLGTNQGTRHTLRSFRVKGLLNPQPSILNPQPLTFNLQPSTFNPHPSTLNTYETCASMRAACIDLIHFESLSSSPVAVFPHKSPILICTGRH